MVQNAVQAAMASEPHTQKWLLTFVDGEDRAGTLATIVAGICKITNDQGIEYFFDTDKVVYLRKAAK